MAREPDRSASPGRAASPELGVVRQGSLDQLFCDCGAGPGRHTASCPYNVATTGPEDTPTEKRG